MRWVSGSASVVAALALVLSADGQGLGKKITPVRVVMLIDGNTKGIPAKATIKQVETTGAPIGKRAVNQVRKHGTREEMKRFEGVYFTQGANITFTDGKAVSCNVLLSDDVGKAKLRNVKSLGAIDAVSDRGMGTWYGYTVEFDQTK